MAGGLMWYVMRWLLVELSGRMLLSCVLMTLVLLAVQWSRLLDLVIEAMRRASLLMPTWLLGPKVVWISGVEAVVHR